MIPPLDDTRYFVYYQSGGLACNVSFSLTRDQRSYVMMDLPLEPITNIHMVAITKSNKKFMYLPSTTGRTISSSMLNIVLSSVLHFLPFFITVVAESPEVVVSGEGSGMTGTSYTLTCRVSLPSGVEPDSLDIQWLGLPTPQPVNISTGVYISNITLNPLLPNNTGYTCTARYIINGVSSLLVIESICISDISKCLHYSFYCEGESHFNYTDATVKVVGSGTGEVGSVYTLTCTVTLSHRARDSSVSILWQGPSTDEQTVIMPGDQTMVKETLSLVPLALAHGGGYICNANYTVCGETVSTSDVENIFPISEYFMIINILTLLMLMFQFHLHP